MTVRLLPEPGWPEDKGKEPPAGTRRRPAQSATGHKPPPVIELEAIGLRGAQVPRWSGPRGRRRGADSLDLTVWPGELVMLTGQPRSGRSALLNVLGLLDRPAAGRYLLNGIDTARLRDKQASALRGRTIGLVFQRKILLPTRSVLDNVMLPLRYSGSRKRLRVKAALDSLDRVGMADRAELMTWQLSADELALCAIARALVTGPGLLLCDEPTAGAGREAAAKIIGLLAGLHREGRTVIIATDDQLAAAYSSRSLRLGPPGPDQIETARPTEALTGTVISSTGMSGEQAGLPR